VVVQRQRASTVWESLWHPRPADCATEERHVYLSEGERRKVIERLDKVERLGVAELSSFWPTTTKQLSNSTAWGIRSLG